MSLPHALLTSLLERPSSGLDLARRFEASIGHFWKASHQQIYRELARMEQAGWIRADDAGGRGGRKVHHVLRAGRAELERWTSELAGAADPPVIRDPLLVRLRAAAVLGDQDLGPALRGRLAEHESRLAAYRGIDERDFGGDLDRTARLRRLILEAGIRTEELQAQWCRDVLAELGSS